MFAIEAAEWVPVTPTWILIVSAPAPPSNESVAWKVMPPVVEYKALNVSAPEPVVRTSALDVNGKATGAAVKETAAYVPPTEPAV
jgi:hypothetical protein